MVFLPEQIASNLLSGPEFHRMPWDVAPTDLKEAFTKALEAKEMASAATVHLQITKHEAEIIKNEWDAEARELVREDKPLPSRDSTDRANFKVINAQEDLEQAETVAREAEFQLGVSLNKPELRTEWQEAMQKQLDADKKILEAKSVEVIRVTNRIQQLQSFSNCMGVWPHYGAPEIDQNNYVSVTIQEALNAKLWQQPQPAAEAKFQS
jgi:hypothetical protein